MRTGVLDESGNGAGIDPFTASYLHLIDVGVMGHCIHGKTGLCAKAGIGFYQSGMLVEQPNMSVEDFRWIAEQSKGRCNQFALGGRGDPDCDDVPPDMGGRYEPSETMVLDLSEPEPEPEA